MKFEKKYKLVLFDLDGTLVDSAPDLAWCGDEMMRQLGLPIRGLESARHWVGNGVEKFVKRTLTGDMEGEPESELYDSGIEIFNRLYAENVSLRSKLYPGVINGLERMGKRELQLACVTNKAGRFAYPLIEDIGLKSYFELVVAGDTTAKKKPDPMPLQYAADHYRIEPYDCLLVGDSSNDVKAARAAGFDVACVPYGYNHGEDISISNPDFIVNGIDQLAALFESN